MFKTFDMILIGAMVAAAAGHVRPERFSPECRSLTMWNTSREST